MMKRDCVIFTLLSISLIGYIIGIVILLVNNTLGGIVFIISTLVGIVAGIAFLYELHQDTISKGSNSIKSVTRYVPTRII